MLIRNIVADDNAAMAAIIRNSLEEFDAAKPGTVYYDKTTDHLSDLFTSPASQYFVIEEDGEIAGGAGYYPTEGLPEKTCELVKLYVSKKFRRKSFGGALLQKCMEEARKAGYEKMYLESMPELTSALPLYEKNRFTYLSHSMGNSGHNGCDVWMIRDL
jgi:putative acetyltransferase